MVGMSDTGVRSSGQLPRFYVRGPLNDDFRRTSSTKPDQRRVTGDIAGRNTVSKNMMPIEGTVRGQAWSIGRRARHEER